MKRFNWLTGACFALSFFALSALVFSCDQQGGNGTEEFTVNFAAEPATAGSVIATVNGKTIENGKKVAKNTEVVFTYTVKNKNTHEFEKWEGDASGKNDSVTVKVTKPINVRAKIKTKTPEQKVAKITELKVVNAAQPNQPLETFDATALENATGTTPVPFELPVDAQALNIKLVATTDPTDATVTYDPPALGQDGGYKFTAETNVTITVVKKGNGTDTTPEFRKTEYKFRVTLATPQTKKAKLTALKLVKVTGNDEVLNLKDKLTEAATSAGATIALPYDQSSGVPLKFDSATTDPATGATVTYAVENDASAHPDQTITFTKDAKTVTVTVSATDHETTTYKFIISVTKGTMPDMDIAVISDRHMLSTKQLEEAKTDAGCPYIFKHDQGEVEFKVGFKDTNHGATTEYSFNNTPCDGKCNVDTEEKPFVITLKKTDCDDVKYTFKIKKNATAPAKHELESITIDDIKLSANDMVLATQGKYENGRLTVGDFKASKKISWVNGNGQPTALTLKYKKKGDTDFTTVSEANATVNEITLDKIAGVTKDNSPIEIEIEVTGDGDQKTKYILKINVR